MTEYTLNWRLTGVNPYAEFTPCKPNCNHCKKQVKAIPSDYRDGIDYICPPEEIKFADDALLLHSLMYPAGVVKFKSVIDTKTFNCCTCAVLDEPAIVEQFEFRRQTFYHIMCFKGMVEVYMNQSAFDAFEQFNKCMACWFENGTYADDAIMMSVSN
jgi:hypothetical protein